MPHTISAVTPPTRFTSGVRLLPLVNPARCIAHPGQPAGPHLERTDAGEAIRSVAREHQETIAQDGRETDAVVPSYLTSPLDHRSLPVVSTHIRPGFPK